MNPLYVLPQQKSRALFPKIALFVGLGGLLYIGLLLNIMLLDLNAQEETMANIIGLGIVILLVGIGCIVALRRSQEKYYFYPSCITVRNANLPYTQIKSVQRRQNMLDKLFHTYQLTINNSLVLYHLPQEVVLEQYIEQLISYASRQGR